MARRNPKVDERKVEARVTAMKDVIGELRGVDLIFADDMLTEYARTREMVETLGETIQEEGITVTQVKGGKGNNHRVRVENPLFGIYYKATARMADLATRTSRFVKQGRDETEGEVDELAEFNDE